jgi:hypothetical protein
MSKALFRILVGALAFTIQAVELGKTLPKVQGLLLHGRWLSIRKMSLKWNKGMSSVLHPSFPCEESCRSPRFGGQAFYFCSRPSFPPILGPLFTECHLV